MSDLSISGYPALTGLVCQLPDRADHAPTRPAVSWTADDREKWLAAVIVVLDYVLPVGTFVLSADKNKPSLNFRQVESKRHALEATRADVADD